MGYKTNMIKCLKILNVKILMYLTVGVNDQLKARGGKDYSEYGSVTSTEIYIFKIIHMNISILKENLI